MSRLFIALIASLYCTATLADATIVLKDQEGSKESQKSTTTIKVKDGMLLFSDSDDRESTTMYREADKALVQIDHESRTYIVIDQQAKDALTARMGQMGEQMAMIQEQLKNLPPEQREMAMQQMKQFTNMGQPDKAPSHTVKKTDRSETVGGVKCDIVELYKGSEKTGGACVASASSLGISKKDFGTVKSMMDMMQSFASQFGQEPMPDFEAVGGFPIKYTGGAGDRQAAELVSVKVEDLDASLFSMPEGYTQRSMGQ